MDLLAFRLVSALTLSCIACTQFGATAPLDGGSPADSAANPGALGTEANPAPSCKALSVAGSASGHYFVQPNPADSASRFQTHCDMTTLGGGWTQVTAAVAAANVTLLLGTSGRQMLKCSTDGATHLISPSFTTPWQWNASAVQLVPGEWTANGVQVQCGSDPEWAKVSCTAFWGVGCNSGTGVDNVKLIPGGMDVQSNHTCAGSTSTAHTRAGFSICSGNDEFAQYVVFVRAD